MKHLLTRGGLLLGALCVLASGCAQEVGDIDRTQPNKLKKSDFEGVWYYRQTVTDVPAEIDYAFIGYTNTLEKIRWDIRENYLIAYRAYEYRPGTDPGAGSVVRGETQVIDGAGEGFDPKTYKGEPVAAFRIISHFDIQRQYSAATGEQTNVITENGSDREWHERDYMRVDWSSNAISEVFWISGMTSMASVNYFVYEEEGGEDAFYKERREVKREGKMQNELGYFDFVNKLHLNPDLMDCWYYGLNCIPGEVKIRHSFARLEDAERDYEPAFYDDQSMNKFGYFRVEREVYDRREGTTDTKRLTYANRHDIWQNDFQRDADGNYLRDKNNERIPTPMAERTPKPIVYYLSPNFPEPVLEGAQKVANDWDRAFTRAVAAAKGMTPADVTAQYGKMYVLCHNPVDLEKDEDVCDPRPLAKRKGEFKVRNGDIRYNILWWVDRPQAAGPLGYGPSHPDPETGEIVSGTAYVYGAGVDTYAQYGVDVVKMVNGDYTDEQLQAGFDVTEYLERTRRNDIDPRARLSPEMVEKLNQIPLDKNFASRVLGEKKAARLNFLTSKHPGEMFDTNVTRHRQALDRMKEGGWDKRVLDTELLNVITKGTHTSVNSMSSAQLDALLKKHNPLEMRDLIGRRRNFHDLASRKNIYLAEFADDAVVGAGLRFKGETDYEKVWNGIRSLIFHGVGAHEVGHSIGLRHNFQGSYDAINFFDKYWDLRKETLRTPQGLGDFYAQVQMTDAQRDGGMREYQYSSIMDYHSRFNGDWAGIGKYDEAAILFAYTFGTYKKLDTNNELPSQQEAGFIEVFNNVQPAGMALLRRYDGRTSPADRSLLENHYYGTVVNTLGGPDSLKGRELMKYGALKAMRDAGEEQRPVEVPYMFCSDEIESALISCKRFDLGADPLEIVKTTRENYFTYYPLTHFRRERRNFDPMGPLNRAYRTGLTFLNVYQQWLIGNQDVEDDLLDTYYILAMSAGFNTLAEMMRMPRYGTYAQGDDQRWEWQSYDMDGGANSRVVKMGEGRRFRSIYDTTSGYFYFERLQESGHFWDWMGALFAAIEPTARTVAVDTAADREAYMVPFYLVFEDEITRLFNGQLTDSFGDADPLVTADGRIVVPPMFTLNAGVTIDPLTGTPLSEITGQGEPVKIEGNLTQERYAALYGIAFFNELYTQHYVDQARVFKLGHGEQISVEPGEGFEVITFTDPTTGLAYGTVRPQGGSAIPSLGENLVLEGQRLAAEVKADPNGNASFALSNVVDTINMIGAIIELYGIAN